MVDYLPRSVNAGIWGYKLNGMDKLQLLKYNVGGHYDWHLDIGSGDHMYRKLSFIIPLSPPNPTKVELIVKLGQRKGYQNNSRKDDDVPLIHPTQSNSSYKENDMFS